jgi:hypothetical protein
VLDVTICVGHHYTQTNTKLQNIQIKLKMGRFSISLDCPFLLPLWYSLTFIRFVYPMFSISLDCPFLLPLRYSLTFIRFVYPMFSISLDCPFLLPLRTIQRNWNIGYTKRIKVREYRRGNKKRTIQRNWKHRVHKTNKG